MSRVSMSIPFLVPFTDTGQFKMLLCGITLLASLTGANLVSPYTEGNDP